MPHTAMRIIWQVKIALCQLEVGTDKEANIQTATKAVKVRHSGEQAAVMDAHYFSASQTNRSFTCRFLAHVPMLCVLWRTMSMPCLP